MRSVPEIVVDPDMRNTPCSGQAALFPRMSFLSMLFWGARITEWAAKRHREMLTGV
jgi:hypothetical protein